jgi:hypothetical protein
MEKAMGKRTYQLDAESRIAKLKRLRDALPCPSELRTTTTSLISLIENMAEYVSRHETGELLGPDLMLWHAVRQTAEQAIKDVTKSAKVYKYTIPDR